VVRPEMERSGERQRIRPGEFPTRPCASFFERIFSSCHNLPRTTRMGAASSTPTPPPPSAQPPAGCPMHVPTASPPTTTGGCPIDHSSLPRPRPKGELNPVNNIPELAQAPSPGQKSFLPLERTISSIPRASSPSSASACPVASTSNAGEGEKPVEGAKADQWEYPSPQQFYNALVRKGWETPEESVEMMVNIHNWLNEEAWAQVRRWEEKHDGCVLVFVCKQRRS
jgi:cytochrome c heme-lyase